MNMITKKVELNISKDGTKIELTKPLVLHKGDGNVCLDLHIIGADHDYHKLAQQTKDTTGTTVMAEVNVLKPNSQEFKFQAEVLEGNIVHFEVPSALMDEYAEVGIHLVQLVICYGLTSRMALPTFQMTVKDRFGLDTINTMPVTPQIVEEINKIITSKMAVFQSAITAHDNEIAQNKQAILHKASENHKHEEYNKKDEQISVEQLPDETVATLAKVRDIRFVDQLPSKDEQEPDTIYFVVG
ncbi:MAG: hypothetical protein [Malazfec virus 1]